MGSHSWDQHQLSNNQKTPNSVQTKAVELAISSIFEVS